MTAFIPCTPLMLFALALVSAGRISDRLATAAGREVLMVVASFSRRCQRACVRTAFAARNRVVV